MDLGGAVDRTRWSTRLPLLLVATTVLMSVPYALAGPGFFLDDWFALRAGRLDGWHMAAGSEQWAARPGAGVVYALTFGLLQNRPLAYFVAAAVLMAVAAVLVFVIGRRLIGSVAVAGAVAFVWLLSPNHGSLEMWPSALNILLALVLALAGIERIIRSESSAASDLIASLLMAAGTLTYEAAAPVSAVAVLLVALHRRAGRRRIVLLASGWGSLVLALGWMAVNWHPGKKGIEQWLSPERVVSGHLADGVFGPGLVGQIAGVGVLSLIAVLAGRRLLRGTWADRRAALLMGWGVGIIVLGAIPFVRYFYAPVGFGDRVTVVSGIGGALVLVGSALELKALQPRASWLVFAVCAIVALGWRVEQTSNYATAADDGRRILHAVEHRFPEPPGATLVFGPHPVLEHNVGAFLQFDWPVQWLYGRRDVDAYTTFSAEEFEEADPRYRFDIVEMSNITGTVTP